MLTIPYQVAKLISANRHPVYAWRYYYSVSQGELAVAMNITLEEVKLIETTNRHLKPEIAFELARVFNIVEQAIRIRYTQSV